MFPKDKEALKRWGVKGQLACFENPFTRDWQCGSQALGEGLRACLEGTCAASAGPVPHPKGPGACAPQGPCWNLRIPTLGHAGSADKTHQTGPMAPRLAASGPLWLEKVSPGGPAMCIPPQGHKQKKCWGVRGEVRSPTTSKQHNPMGHLQRKACGSASQG